MHHVKKLLCYTAITAILNSSFQPLYAGSQKISEDSQVEKQPLPRFLPLYSANSKFAPFNYHEIQVEEPSRPRLLVLEDFLQGRVKASANVIQTLTPDFIKGPVSSAYKQVCSWLETKIMDIAPSILAKTPLEVDYAQDLNYWHAHFTGEIGDLKNSSSDKPLDQERLKELQNIVWSGLLSPYHYEQGLNELKKQGPKSLLKRIGKQFREEMKSSPAFLRQNFQRDLFASLKDILTEATYGKDTRVGDIGDSEKGIENFGKLLTYYRELQDPFDYTHSLVDFRRVIQQNKDSLNLTDPQYWALNKAIVKAVNKRDQKEYSILKATQRQFIQSSQELPYYGEDVSEDAFNSSLPPIPVVKEEPLKEESFSFINPIKGLTQLAYKGIKYVTEHPIEAITIGLASQVAASAALNTFKVNSFKTPEEKSRSLDDGSQKQPAADEKILSQEESKQERPSPLLSPKHIKRAIGDEFQINQFTAFWQNYPSVASLSNGNAFVAWEGYQTGNDQIYGRLFSMNGTALSNEFGINQNTTSNEVRSSAAGLTNGNIFVAWEGYQNGYGQIYGRVFLPNGTAINNEFAVNQNTTFYQERPSVAGLANGNVFVAWQGIQTGDYDIYGRIISANGLTLTNEFTVNQNTLFTQWNPSVGVLPNGNAFMVWSGDQAGDLDIYGRLFSSNGTALSNDFRINQVTTSAQDYASIAHLSNGNTFVTWMGAQVGDWDIYGRIFSSNGTALSNEFGINQNTTGDQEAPRVVGLSNGNVFVTWHGNQTGDYDVYGRLFSANGAALSNDFDINQVLTSTQQDPSVASLTNGDIFVSWFGYQTGDYDIYGRIFTNDTLSSLVSPSTTGVFSTTSSPTTYSPTSTTGQTSTSATSTGLLTSTSSTSDFTSASSPLSRGKVAGIVVGGFGGITLLTVGGIIAKKYYSSIQHSRDSKFNLEMASAPSNPFAPKSSGFTEHPSFVGALKDRSYAIWKELSEGEAKLLQPRIAKKISHSPSSYIDKIPFQLGKGKFGATYAGSDIETKELYAIKEVYGRNAVDESLREGKIQDELKGSSQVISLVDYMSYEPTEATEQPRLFQVMPLAYTNGVGYRHMLSLLKKENYPLHEELITDNFQQLMKGLAYMHGRDICHLDIKDENILYMLDGTLRIADFGRARKLENNDQIKDDQLGDRRKFSPEIFAFVRSLLKQGGTKIEKGEIADSFSGKTADTWAGGLYTLELWLNDDLFSDSIVPYQTKVISWTNASFEKVLAEVKPLQEASSESFPGVLRQVLAVNFKKRMMPDQVIKKLSSFKIISSEERTQAFEKLAKLSASQEAKISEASYLNEIENPNMYFSTKPKEENENYTLAAK